MPHIASSSSPHATPRQERARSITPRVLLSVTTSAAIFALCAQAQAQDPGKGEAEELELAIPAPRQGYWLAASASGALNLNTSTEDDIGAIPSAMFQGRLGEMVTDWLGFGLQFGGGFGASDTWESGFGGLMLDVQLVAPPLPALSLHIGFGAGGISLTEIDAEEDELKGTGGAYYALGLAWDLFPFYESGSGGFALTPHLQVHHMPGAITASTFIVLGLEGTWWTGLDDDKLELPFEEQYKKREE